MRPPDDLPRRSRRSASGNNRRRVVLIVAAVALFFLLTSIRGIAGLYTDYLWFDSLDQWSTRSTMLTAQATLALIFIAAFFLLSWTNLYMAERLAPPFRPAGPEDELLERYHDLVAGRMGRVRIGVSALLALIAGSGTSAEWNSWLLFRHGREFGVEDPQFGRDVSFYVFKLPFLAFVVDWLFAALLIVLIITAVAHYLNGGIRVQSAAPRVTSQVKAHLSVLLAILALVKTADYWLQRFELTVSTRGVVDGASYTDVHAQLQATNLLVLISVAAAALFVGNIFRRGWTLPVVAVALWAFVALAVGGIYPQIVQNFTVQPNESAKERPYIQRNITATRAAMNLAEVDTRSYQPETDPDNVNLASNQDTIRNIRLWDPSADISGKVFEQLQRIRDYYRIDDIDVDRYMIDGEPTQVQLGARTLDPDRVPGDSWENQHLAYTHGFGAVMAPSNASAGSEPDFIIRDVPVQDPGGDLTVEQPRIYFGEGQTGYSIVNTGRNEIDYQDAEDTKNTKYEGADGVEAGSIFRRAAFALRFGDLNPLISDYLSSDSRVIYIRDVVDRVKMLAPFLHADTDPYPVLLDGKVLWVVDLYTTTDRYPYAQRAETDQVSDESGLDRRFNYVRNSVKATVDAYEGTVNMYVMVDDPIIEAYREAFPDLFKDAADMPEGLDAHLRYPEDLFRIQTAAWERYHLSDPQDFYDQTDAWRIARDPGTAGAAEGTPVTNEAGEPTGQITTAPIAPYYQLLRLPGNEEAEFVLMRPFVPRSEDDRRQQLTAFMAARMDPGEYGKLVVYEMPSGDLPDGPGIVAGKIRATGAVSDLETLRSSRTGGSRVRYGNLLLVPIDNALVYVRPFYVESETADQQIPRLEKVIAVFDDQVVIEDTLQMALQRLFGEEVATQENPDAESGNAEEPGDVPTEPEGSIDEQASALLAEAEELFAEAEQALADGDLGTYQQRNEEARDKVREATELLTGGTAPTETTLPPEGEGSAGAATPTTTTTPPRPA